MDTAEYTNYKIEKENYLFDNKDLFKLFIPIIIEQFLEFSVGLIDSIMVAHVGEPAVSGVSIVDMVIALFISIFASISTGGAVIIGQYLGAKDKENSKKSASQLVWFLGILSIIIMIIIYLIKPIILTKLFRIDADVYDSANIYFLIVASSIPFLALYNGGAAIFRSIGNSKLPMKIMFIMNLLNIFGNAIFIYGFKFGVSGVAIPTLVSRIGAALIIIILALNKNNIVYLERTFKYKIDKDMLKRILNIGIPYGLENGMFYFGRIIVLSLVAMFGTVAIAANSVATNIVVFQVLPGMSMGIGLTVVISRCVGANDYKQARYYTKKIMTIIYIGQIVSSVIVLSLLPLALKIYHLSSETTNLIYKLSWMHAIAMIVVWPLGYSLPVVLRASGDAKFPMIVSSLSMILCRIVLAYILGLYFNLGVIGTWLAMFVDWIAKGLIFVWRYLSGKWMDFKSI